MACRRGNCVGVPLCSAAELCCIQFQQDCGGGCAGVPVGYSRIQVNAAGNLEVCSNVGGVCTCEEIDASAIGGIDTLVDNGDGTFTHTAVDGTPVIIDVCTLVNDGGCTDTLVDNGDGTFTHTAVDGTPVIINVCDLINADNCFFKTGSVVGAGTVLISPIAPATPDTLVEPAISATLTNTSDETMICSGSVSAPQMNIQNAGATSADVSLRYEYSIDNGGSWNALASYDITGQVAPVGLDGDFVEVTGAQANFLLSIPAGGSETVLFRRFYRSISGITGTVNADAMQMVINCDASPG